MGLLSWLSGRRAAAGNVAAPAVQTSPEGRPAAPAWRRSPPLPRTVTPLVPVTDPAAFRASLSTWQDASFTSPLGHLVSPEAPSGLGYGLATTATPTVNRTETARQFDPPQSPGPGVTRSERAATPAPATPLQRQTPLTSAPPPQMTTRRFEGLSLTGAAPTASDAGPGTEQAGTATASQAVPPTGIAPVVRPPIFGLGEPLAGLPPTAQREPAAHSGPPAPGPAPAQSPQTGPWEPGPEPPEALSGAEEIGGPVPRSAPGATDGEAAEPFAPLLGDRPAEAVTDPGPAPSGAQRDPNDTGRQTLSPGLPPAVTGKRPGDGGQVPPPPVAPLLAQRALPLINGAPPGGGVPAEHGAWPAVPVRWPGPAQHGGRGPTDSPTDEGIRYQPLSGPAVQRSTSPVLAAPVPERAHPPAGHHNTGQAAAPVAQVRPFSQARPVQRLADTGQLQAATPPAEAGPLTDAGGVAVASGVARRAADGSVVFHAAPTNVQRDAAPSAPEGPGPPSEPPEPGPVPQPGPLDESVAPEGPGGSTAAAEGGAAPAADSDADPPVVTDELVRALYSPLSRMLKAELRLERERVGSLIDTRH